MSTMQKAVYENVTLYQGMWGFRGEQTKYFKQIVPKEAVDFDETFQREKLGDFFKNPDLKTNLMGSFNCNFLYRDLIGESKVPIYNDENHTIMAPVGFPGRDLKSSGGEEGHCSRSSHLIGATHNEDSTWCLNDMLPQTPQEFEDFKIKLGLMEMAMNALKMNIPISNCGSKVCAKATSLGVDHSMGIRDFFIQMVQFDEEFRSGRPGYVLMDEKNRDVAGDGEALRDLINRTFDNENLKLHIFIQPPSFEVDGKLGGNSQLVSHIHGFLLDEIPDCLAQKYVNCADLVAVREEILKELDEEGEVLQRIPSNPPPVEEDAVLNRQGSNPPQVKDCGLTRTTTVA